MSALRLAHKRRKYRSSAFTFSALNNSYKNCTGTLECRKMAQQRQRQDTGQQVLFSVTGEFPIPTGEKEELHHSDGEEIAV